jgi:competence protein ComEC
MEPRIESSSSAQASLTLPEDVSIRQRLYDFGRTNPLFFVAVAAILGILVDDRLWLSWPVWVSLAIGAVLVGSRFRQASMISLFVLVFVFGGLRHQSSRVKFRQASLDNPVWFHSLQVEAVGNIVVGTLVEIPRVVRHPLADVPTRRDQSPWQTQSLIELSQVHSGGRATTVTGRLRLVIDGVRDDLKLGDVVRVFGRLNPPREASNPGSQNLSLIYENLSLHGHLQVEDLASVETIEPSLSLQSWIGRKLAGMAWFGRNALAQHLGAENGALATGIVMGSRDSISRQIQDELLVTGTVHWLSVSGLHLAIVVSIVVGFCRLLCLPRLAQLLTILAVCVFYTALTGGRPPVMRAAILVMTFSLALHAGRLAQLINTLSIAALILIVLDPRNVFVVGVHLSFLAVATLMIAGRNLIVPTTLAKDASSGAATRFDELVRQGKSPIVLWMIGILRYVRGLIWSSACVTAISTPLVWYHFHIVSIISVIINVVLSPVLFVALGMGLATVLGASIHPQLGVIPGWISSKSIDVMLAVIRKAAEIPGGYFWLPSPPVFWVIVFYVVMSVTLLWRPTRRLRWIRLCFIASWFIIGVALSLRGDKIPEGTLQTTFVDVGHGTSVVLQYDDQVWLYDCGWLGNDDNSSDEIENVLWSEGITFLDGIIISHADADHFSALPALVERFRVGRIVTPPGMLAQGESALDPIRKSIAQAGIEVTELSVGQSIEGWMQVLHPHPDRDMGSDNANSLVVEIRLGNRSLLLPGDLEPPGTAVLTSGPRPPAGSVLMAPHHGSLRMDADMVLAWCRPSLVVVSGGRRARSPEVAEMLATGGADVRVTSVQGAIRVQIDREGQVFVQSWKENPW